MRILPDNQMLVYSGRIDWSNKNEPVWTYPATFVKIKFCGDHLSVIVCNKNNYWNNYIGVIADGIQTKKQIEKNGESKITIELENTKDRVHEVMIFKRQDACHEMKFLGFELDDDSQLLFADKLSKRRIEVYGDSVSAGEVSEALDYIAKEDPADQNGEYSNSWYSYSWIAARKLDAQLHDIAQGGAALLDRTGWYHAPNYIGMESIWDKIRYNPDYGTVTKWDFLQYTPQIVIVALGQNDSNPSDYMKTDYNGEKANIWRKNYTEFLKKIRKTYPDAWIICQTTLLMHDKSWDEAISSAIKAAADEKISQCIFKRNGTATPGHLRIPEAEEMANELCEHIKGLSIEGF